MQINRRQAFGALTGLCLAAGSLKAERVTICAADLVGRKGTLFLFGPAHMREMPTALPPHTKRIIIPAQRACKVRFITDESPIDVPMRSIDVEYERIESPRDDLQLFRCVGSDDEIAKELGWDWRD